MSGKRAAYGGSLALDIAAGFLGLLFLSPLMAAMAVAVRWRMGSPVLFVQLRPGLNGKLFRLYKFRTMAGLTGPDGKRLADAERLTGLGRWIRRWSLDELPELFNVLRGDMSIVGPRPLLPQYLASSPAEQARRHEVKPGITGWAQINGRNAISWEEKFALDVWYVDHRSFPLDLKIVLRTMAAVIRRKGISAEGEATMPEFMGTPPPAVKGNDG